jgi:hypothetical protein
MVFDKSAADWNGVGKSFVFARGHVALSGKNDTWLTGSPRFASGVNQRGAPSGVLPRIFGDFARAGLHATGKGVNQW